jgi:hypothetical protein
MDFPSYITDPVEIASQRKLTDFGLLMRRILYHFDRKFTNSENLLAEMAVFFFFFLSSSDLKQGLFFWLLRVTELTVEMVQ